MQIRYLPLVFVFVALQSMADEVTNPDGKSGPLAPSSSPTAATPPAQQPLERPCIANFEKKGNFMVREMTSWQEGQGDYDIAFRKVAQATTKLGWAHVNTNKETGTMTAGGGGGSISIVVEEPKKGMVRVEAKMIVSGPDNMFFTDSKAQTTLCMSVEAPWM